jgi:hypothetical protein
MTSTNRAGPIAYWALVVVLLGFGYLGPFSIGLPFLLLGIALAIVSQRRHETGVVAAGVATIVGFTVGYILVAPLGCTTSANGVDPVEHTVCTNILGIDYSGTGVYNPSLLPGLVAGVVLAVVFGLSARWIAHRVASRHDAMPPALA